MRSRREERDDVDDAQAVDQQEERVEAALFVGAAAHLQLGSALAAIATQPRLAAAPEGDALGGDPAGRLTIDDRLPDGGTTKLEGRVGRAPKEIGGSAPPPNIGAQDDLPGGWEGTRRRRRSMMKIYLFPNPDSGLEKKIWT